jgi:hypothetical protein
MAPLSVRLYDDATRDLWERHSRRRFVPGHRRIVATHSHPDHVGNAAWLAADSRRRWQ